MLWMFEGIIPSQVHGGILNLQSLRLSKKPKAKLTARLFNTVNTSENPVDAQWLVVFFSVMKDGYNVIVKRVWL